MSQQPPTGWGPGNAQSSGEGLGGIMQAIMGPGRQIVGPNGTQYANQYSQDEANAGGFAQMAGGYQQSAPTIGQASQGALNQASVGQAGLAGYYQNMLNGHGPSVAQNQFQQATDQSINAQMAMANSARGGPAAMAEAQRQAQQGNATTLAGASAQSGIIRAQEQQQAAQGMQGLQGIASQQALGQYGTAQNAMIQQGQLQSTNQAQQNAQQLGLYGLQQGEQQLQAGTLNDFTNANLQAQGLQTAATAQNNGLGMTLLQAGMGAASGGTGAISGLLQAGAGAASGGAGAASGGAGAISSDERVKGDIRSEGGGYNLADDFLRHVDPKSYRYREGKDPSGNPVGGRYLGVMAQQLEQTPEIGSQMVRDTPQGKVISMPETLSALLAAAGRLDEKHEALKDYVLRGRK